MVVIANTLFQQHERRLYTWTSPDASILKSDRLYHLQLKIEKLYTMSKNCGSDHELLIAKFRLKLKKVGKSTRPFRYILHQNPYDYTVEVTDRFKRLSLVDRVPEELLYRRQ